MEVVRTSEIFAKFYQYTRRNIREDNIFHCNWCDNRSNLTAVRTLNAEEIMCDIGNTLCRLSQVFQKDWKYFFPIHNYPEDGNCNVCRNAGNPANFYNAYSQKSHLKLHPWKSEDYNRDNYIVTWMCDYRRGLDWLTNHLYTRLSTTNNYSATAYLRTLLITTAHAKFSQSFTSRILVTDLNNGDSSASVLTSLPAGWYSTTERIAPTILVITSRYGQHRKHPVSNRQSIDACVFVAAESVYRAVAQKWSLVTQSPLGNIYLNRSNWCI
jgi:hypothetical protein